MPLPIVQFNSYKISCKIFRDCDRCGEGKTLTGNWLCTAMGDNVGDDMTEESRNARGSSQAQNNITAADDTVFNGRTSHISCTSTPTKTVLALRVAIKAVCNN